MGWRSKKKDDGPVFRAPPGYRDSGRPIFATNEVVSSAFQIRELLHSDDTGQVYEARDMLLERVVAIKAAWRDDDVPPLLLEARAPTAITHACAADIYSLGNHHSCEYLVAERIPGVALAQHIADTYEAGELISGPAAVDILSDLARGLSAVHGAGYALIHLTTCDIAITPQGRLVFTRFALGQGRLDSQPVVLAPEIITGGAVPELGTPEAVAADLYALGCVAVELCTGSAAFPGDTVKARQFAHVHHRPPQLSATREDIPTELSDLVDELLSKNPGSRPPSADDVVRQLSAVAERAAASRRRVRVLVVDDDPARVRPLWSVLRRAHACTEIDAVVDADEAGRKLQHQQPDVLVLNLDLPGSMNGLEMCIYLRGLAGGGECMFVALGRNLRDGDAAVLEQIGVDHVLAYSSASYHALTELIRQLA